MSSLHIATLALIVRAQLKSAELLQCLPASPYTLGENLARQAHDLVEREKLGYYPALDYLKQRAAIDGYLLDAAEQVAAITAQLVRQHITNRLEPIFSSVRFLNLQITAFALPPIRPGQPQAQAQLARFYTPDTAKCDLLLTLIRKQQTDEGLVAYASATTQRWLADDFAEFEITSARLV